MAIWSNSGTRDRFWMLLQSCDQDSGTGQLSCSHMVHSVPSLFVTFTIGFQQAKSMGNCKRQSRDCNGICLMLATGNAITAIVSQCGHVTLQFLSTLLHDGVSSSELRKEKTGRWSKDRSWWVLRLNQTWAFYGLQTTSSPLSLTSQLWQQQSQFFM